jgi:PII-like signaling protein
LAASRLGTRRSGEVPAIPGSESFGTRLVVFLTEDDRTAHRETCNVLLDRAREEGLAGATVWRGIEGFGRSGRVRTSRFPDTAAGLPLAVEFIDQDDQIEDFLPVIHELAPGALVTSERVRISRYLVSPGPTIDDPMPGKQEP